MRDGADNCITICNMENLDPMGVHTGDSHRRRAEPDADRRDYQLLRSAALNIIRALGVEGGCNVPVRARPAHRRLSP